MIDDEGSGDQIVNTCYPLAVHHLLPASWYEECTVALEMPGRLELLVNGEYKRADEEVELEVVEHPELMTTTKLCRGSWDFHANRSDMFASKCTGFIHWDQYDGEDHFRSDFNITCAYDAPLNDDDDVHSMQGPGYESMPTAVLSAPIDISNYYTTYGSHGEFHRLKFMESWMVVARHLRNDAIELARLQSRFEGTYLLIEVGLTQKKNVARSVFIGMRSNVPDQPLPNTVAFEVVPLADKEALLALFTTQTTDVQFLERDGSSERLPPADYRVARISLLDVGSARVMKLGEVYSYSEAFKNEEPIDLYHSTSARNFYCFEQIVRLTPDFEESVTATKKKGSKYAASVKLSVEILGFEGANGTSEFSSVLNLWKFSEICMTGETS